MVRSQLTVLGNIDQHGNLQGDGEEMDLWASNSRDGRRRERMQALRRRAAALAKRSWSLELALSI